MSIVTIHPLKAGDVVKTYGAAAGDSTGTVLWQDNIGVLIEWANGIRSYYPAVDIREYLDTRLWKVTSWAD